MIRPITTPLRALLTAVYLGSAAFPADADALLEEAVDFTGTVAFVGAGAPALVIAAVRGR